MTHKYLTYIIHCFKYLSTLLVQELSMNKYFLYILAKKNITTAIPLITFVVEIRPILRKNSIPTLLLSHYLNNCYSYLL